MSKNRFTKTLAGFVVIVGMATPMMTQAKPSMNQIKAAATPMQVTSGSRIVLEQKVAVFVNGRAINWGGEKLLQTQNQVYVPLKPFVEAAKLTTTYDLTTQKVTLQRGNQLVQISQPPSTSQILVPLRFVAEKLGGALKVVSANPQNDNIIEIYVTLTGQQGSGIIKTVRSQPVQQGRVVSISEAIEHNLKALNVYRANAGIPALKLDDKLNAFAHQGSVVLLKNHKPHHHFASSDIWAAGFTGGAAENQGDPNGWPIRGNLNTTIDDILKAMFDEGPGGGHHDNMLNRDFRRVGVGLVVSGNKLYLTNDFSK